MKKVISVLLTVILALSCFAVVGFAAPANGFVTENGIEVRIAPYLYKSALYQMDFPNPETYEIKEKSDIGDYTIASELNDLSYCFVFPAGTTKMECLLSLNGENGWHGVVLDCEKNPGYWEKDENGNVDLTKTMTFNRNETLAECDEYGVLYRDYLRGKNVGGFKNFDKIYWKLSFTRDGEVFTDTFEIKLYDYDKAEKHSLKAVNFNVAGLPFEAIFGGKDVAGNQREIASYFSENDFDIVAVQEDFGYHKHLVENMQGFDYMTNHRGGIPGGDGLNVFTKGMPVYNETRVTWNEACGILTDGSDELTAKGFVYSVIDVGNGIYVDFYNLHADAYGGEGSKKARTSQFKQLAEFIEARSAENDRPVIITGDFNYHIHTHEDNRSLYNTLYLGAGFKDAWMEYHNDGDYFNLHKWHISGLPAWGNWDSVERFMYRAGGGVDIVVDDFRYVEVTNEKGEVISDHSSAECDFTFIKTEDFVEQDKDLYTIKVVANSFFNTLKWIIKDLRLVLSDLKNLPELFEELF